MQTSVFRTKTATLEGRFSAYVRLRARCFKVESVNKAGILPAPLETFVTFVYENGTTQKVPVGQVVWAGPIHARNAKEVEELGDQVLVIAIQTGQNNTDVEVSYGNEFLHPSVTSPPLAPSIGVTDPATALWLPAIAGSVSAINTGVQQLRGGTWNGLFGTVAGAVLVNADLGVTGGKFVNWGLQVIQTGNVTSWTVDLFMSQDGANFTPTAVLSHSKVSPGNMEMIWTTAPKICRAYKLVLTAITLGAGTGVTAYVSGI